MITDDELRQIMPNLPADKRALYLPHLQAAMNEFKINTYLREAAFLAQLAHESMELKAWSENLNYSAQALLRVFRKYFPTAALANAYARQPQKIASRVYANRMGNGNEASGEGWKYRGRGPIQLTGKDNYRNFGNTLGLDLVGNPDSVATPEVGFRVAGAFWVSRGLNELADREDMREITRRINGGFNGLEDRMHFYVRAKAVLSRDDGATRGAATPAVVTRGAAGGGMSEVPPGLSRGVLPGAPETIEMFGGEHDPVRGEEAGGRGGAASKGGAKKGAAKKTAAKKGAAKKGAGKKAGAKKSSSKGAAKKGAAKKAGKAGAAKKGVARKGGAKKGAAKKGGAKKGAAKKGGARKRS